MILFKSLPLRLRTLRDRTSQVTCQKDIYSLSLHTILPVKLKVLVSLTVAWLPGLWRSAIR